MFKQVFFFILISCQLLNGTGYVCGEFRPDTDYKICVPLPFETVKKCYLVHNNRSEYIYFERTSGPRVEGREVAGVLGAGTGVGAGVGLVYGIVRNYGKYNNMDYIKSIARCTVIGGLTGFVITAGMAVVEIGLSNYCLFFPAKKQTICIESSDLLRKEKTMHEYAFVGPRLPGFWKVVNCYFKSNDGLRNMQIEYPKTDIKHSSEVESMDDKEKKTAEINIERMFNDCEK